MSLENISNELAASFRRVLSFKKDDRFPVVLAEFSTDDANKVRAVISTWFRDIWEHESLEQATPAVVASCERLGGLSPGQTFFSTNVNESTLLFCAWWPWRNGQKISIRIGVYDSALDDEAASKIFADLLRRFTA